MSYPLTNLKRCHLFESISERVWKKIIWAHEVNVDLNEPGITAEIIAELLHFNKSAKSNFTVFARPGWQENTYGSDIDVFVETAFNQLRWFALQAKVLKKNRRYTALRDTSDGIMQWDKLNLLEGVSGCKAYYLLYNGVQDWNINAHDWCENSFKEDQFGCSLMESAIAKTYALKKKGIDFTNPTFYDIHPNHAQPWRTLTCCNNYDDAEILYTRQQVLGSNAAFSLVGLDDRSRLQEGVAAKGWEDNPIVNALETSGIRPDVRIIISRNDNLMQ